MMNRAALPSGTPKSFTTRWKSGLSNASRAVGRTSPQSWRRRNPRSWRWRRHRALDARQCPTWRQYAVNIRVCTLRSASICGGSSWTSSGRCCRCSPGSGRSSSSFAGDLVETVPGRAAPPHARFAPPHRCHSRCSRCGSDIAVGAIERIVDGGDVVTDPFGDLAIWPVTLTMLRLVGQIPSANRRAPTSRWSRKGHPSACASAEPALRELDVLLPPRGLHAEQRRIEVFFSEPGAGHTDLGDSLGTRKMSPASLLSTRKSAEFRHVGRTRS